MSIIVFLAYEATKTSVVRSSLYLTCWGGVPYKAVTMVWGEGVPSGRQSVFFSLSFVMSALKDNNDNNKDL